MNRFLAATALLFAASLSFSQEPTKPCVVLISIDGLAASYLDDPRAELPTLRMLAKRGASAEGMITAFPSNTWPAHTTLITGVHPAKHGVIGNTVFDRSTMKNVVYIGDSELTKDEAIRVPTLYDAAKRAGLKTASVIWPCCNASKSLDFIIPDSNKQAMHDRFTTPGFAEKLKAADIDISPLGGWGWANKHSTARDLLYSKVARHLLEKERPDLLLVHFITPDGVEHQFGPHTPEAYAAVAESDQRVKEVWDLLQTPAFKDRATLFVVSDHGFAPYDKIIQPNAVFKRLGLIDVDDKNKPTRRQAWCVYQGGSAFIYLLDPSEEVSGKVRKSLLATEGVKSVLGPDEFMKLGLPHPDKNPQMAHFVATTGPGYSFGEGVVGEDVISAGGHKGTHGHLSQPAFMHATFLVAGPAIKGETKLRTVNSVDVSPTIARILGVTMPDVDGRVLTEILVK